MEDDRSQRLEARGSAATQFISARDAGRPARHGRGRAHLAGRTLYARRPESRASVVSGRGREHGGKLVPVGAAFGLGLGRGVADADPEPAADDSGTNAFAHGQPFADGESIADECRKDANPGRGRRGPCGRRSIHCRARPRRLHDRLADARPRLHERPHLCRVQVGAGRVLRERQGPGTRSRPSRPTSGQSHSGCHSRACPSTSTTRSSSRSHTRYSPPPTSGTSTSSLPVARAW